MLRSIGEIETWTVIGIATVEPFVFVNSTNNSCMYINMLLLHLKIV
uniref:Uncharacterized protein n=1 Tax=Arundo donax TaxID=35708 RepID=A0A0A9AY40_ARUDO